METEANLLGLPCELRLCIYDYVCLFDINLEVGRAVNWAPAFDLTLQSPRRSSRSKLIPWFELMLTCRTVAHELRSHLAKLQYHPDITRQTYVLYTRQSNVLYAIPISGSYNFAESPNHERLQCALADPSLDRMTWQRLPCAPGEVRRIVVNIDIVGRGSRWMTSAAQRPTRPFLELYQILNHIFHYGPFMNTDKPLQRHMHLHELVISVRTDEPSEIQKRRPGMSVENVTSVTHAAMRHFQELRSLLKRMIGSGVLKDYADKMIIRRGATIFEYGISNVGDDDHPIVPWNAEGLHWGLTSAVPVHD